MLCVKILLKLWQTDACKMLTLKMKLSIYFGNILSTKIERDIL